MREALRLHIGTHLRFFARSRLLLGLGVVLAGVWALSLIALWYRRWSFLVEAHLAALGLATTTGRPSAVPDAQAGATPDRLTTLPYGVAIAVGGIAIIVELAKL